MEMEALNQLDETFEKLEDERQKLKKAAAQRLQRTREYEQSHRVGEAVWKTDPLLTAVSDRHSPGNMHEQSWQAHVAALTERSTERDLYDTPFDEGRSAAATFASVYRLPQSTIRAIVGNAFEHLKIVETVKLTYLFASFPSVCDSAIDAPSTA